MAIAPSPLAAVLLLTGLFLPVYSQDSTAQFSFSDRWGIRIIPDSTYAFPGYSIHMRHFALDTSQSEVSCMLQISNDSTVTFADTTTYCYNVMAKAGNMNSVMSQTPLSQVYWLGVPSRNYDSLVYPFKDINLDGSPDIVITRNSGSHLCCFDVLLFSSRKLSRPYQTINCGFDVNAKFEDIDSDGNLEFLTRDYTFADWFCSSIYHTPAPKIVLKFINGKYRVNYASMKNEYSQIDTSSSNTTDEEDPDYGVFADMKVPIRYWRAMLFQLYSGNSSTAWQIFESLFSGKLVARNEFLSAFLTRYHKSPFYPELSKFPNYTEPKLDPVLSGFSLSLDSLLTKGFLNRIGNPSITSTEDTLSNYRSLITTSANIQYLNKLSVILKKVSSPKPVVSSGRNYELLEGYTLLMLRNLGSKNTVHYIPDYIYNEIASRLKRYEPLALVSTLEFKEGGTHQFITPFTYKKSSTYSLSSTVNNDFPLLYVENSNFYAGHALIVDGSFTTTSQLTFQAKPSVLSSVKRITPEVAWLNSRGYSKLITKCIAEKEYQEALTHCNKFMSIFPDAEEFSEVCYLTARSNHLLSNFNDALSGYRGYLQKYPQGDNTCLANFNIADIYDKHSKPEMALPYFTKALEACGDTTALGKYSKSKIEELSPKKAEEYNNYYNYCR